MKCFLFLKIVVALERAILKTLLYGTVACFVGNDNEWSYCVEQMTNPMTGFKSGEMPELHYYLHNNAW